MKYFDFTQINLHTHYFLQLVLFRVLIYGQTTARGCINKMASAILTKNVEKHYSGTGKIIKGAGKLNFSATETFKCMRGTIKIINYIIVSSSTYVDEFIIFCLILQMSLQKNSVIRKNVKILLEKLANGFLAAMTEIMGEEKDLSRHEFFNLKFFKFETHLSLYLTKS